MNRDLHAAKLAAIVFGLGVAMNYPWELAQTPFYAGMDDFRSVLWHCFVAALGDGLLVLLIFAVSAVAQGSRDWFSRPTPGAYAAMLGIGLVAGVAVEWWGLWIAERWQYADRMPLIPGLGVGIVPIAQMIVIPPIVFWIMRRCAERRLIT